MNRNSILLFSVIIIGFIFNQGYGFSFLIKYLLMGMLFFPFLTVSLPKDKIVYGHVLIIFTTMTGLSLVVYCLLQYWDRQLATVAFLLVLTPTATAAPVVISLLKKNVDYVISAVVVTNGLIALLLPFALTILNPGQVNVTVSTVLISTMSVVLIPLILAQLIKNVFAKFADKLASANQFPFLLWLLVLYLATAKASSYLLDSHASLSLVFEIAIIALSICGLNFSIGKYIGGEKYAKEASQSLGQKNTMFMTWVALEFVSPVAALGPVFYLIYQNIYISILLSRGQRLQ